MLSHSVQRVERRNFIHYVIAGSCDLLSSVRKVRSVVGVVGVVLRPRGVAGWLAGLEGLNLSLLDLRKMCSVGCFDFLDNYYSILGIIEELGGVCEVGVAMKGV